MAATYEIDFINNTHRVRDVSTKMIEQIAMDTPVTSMLPKGPRALSSTPEWPLKTYNAARTTGVLEGAIGAYQSNLANKTMLAGRFQKMDRNPSVNKEAMLMVRQYGVSGDPLQDNLADCYKELAVDVEATVLSDNESVVPVADTTASKTRGILRWLSHKDGRFTDTATTPALAYRTVTGEIISNKAAASNVTEANIASLVVAVAKQRKKDMQSFVGICTPDMRNQFGEFVTKVDAGASFATFPVYGWSQKLGEINREVTVYKSSLGRIMLVTSFQLDATVAHFILLDRDMAQLSYAQAPKFTKNPDTTYGERGVLDVLFVNEVLNPQAHGKVIVSSTDI